MMNLSKSTVLKHGSQFTGIGACDLAAVWVGWENVFQVEIDIDCQRELNRLFQNTKKYYDAREVDYKKYRGIINVLSGGSPCQNISLAASRNRVGVNGEKSILWREQIRAADECRPDFVFFENSSTITKHGFEYILHAYSEIGYDGEWYDLQPRYFNVPQKRRERLYALFYPSGFRDRLPEGKVFTGWDEFEYPTWGDSEPKILGVDHWISNRVAKHRAFGNSIVPAIPYAFFQKIESLKSLIQKTQGTTK